MGGKKYFLNWSIEFFNCPGQRGRRTTRPGPGPDFSCCPGQRGRRTTRPGPGPDFSCCPGQRGRRTTRPGPGPDFSCCPWETDAPGSSQAAAGRHQRRGNHPGRNTALLPYKIVYTCAPCHPKGSNAMHKLPLSQVSLQWKELHSAECTHVRCTQRTRHAHETFPAPQPDYCHWQ